MARNGVTQMQLAGRLGKPQTSVSARLRGATPWDANELEQVARIFRVSVAQLVADAERPRPGQPDGDNSARLEGFEPPTFWSGALAPVIPLRRAS